MALPDLLKNLFTLGTITQHEIEIQVRTIYTIYGIGFSLTLLALK